jgi:signal transduction histidine kinase
VLAQGAFVLIILPVLVVTVLLLIFMGVVNHRFYDIEVRASRTGDLAAAAAEHDRLALLGELSATIAHEVRNPLTGIRSLTQMIAEPTVEDEKRVRYAGVILDEVARLDRIVGNLTDLARRSSIGTARTAATELDPLFEDLRLLVDARARRAGVSVRIEPGAQIVHAPREALAQALLNLLLNAIAHAPADSTVTLRSTLDNGVTMSVSDEGPGVPDAERDRIFEPFHTRGGTGLGLTVVRRLADEHNWNVKVANADSGGAVFSIQVPDGT